MKCGCVDCARTQDVVCSACGAVYAAFYTRCPAYLDAACTIGCYTPNGSIPDTATPAGSPSETN